MKSSQAPPTIGKLISAARRDARLTQQQLAARIGKPKQWLSDVERGIRTPSVELVVRLHRILAGDAASSQESLMLWVVIAAAGKVADQALSREITARLQGAQVALLPRSAMESRQQCPTLVNFPDAFGDITVVIGDRREDPPRTGADLLAHSLSAGDVRFLMHLGLDDSVDIVSDKLFVLLDDGRLRARFGHRTLLVVGSPAVNLAARRLNAHGVFRFALSPRAERIEREFRSLDALGDEKLLYALSRMLREPLVLAGGPIDPRFQKTPFGMISSTQIQELARTLENIFAEAGSHSRARLNDLEPDVILDLYRKPGIIDPIAGNVVEGIDQKNLDSALISVGPNPFADLDSNRACVFVSGIHGPGTAQALGMLTRARRADNLQKHPLGGVIKVTLDPLKDWPARFDDAVPDWLTPDYDLAIVGQRLVDTAGSIDRSLEVSETCRHYLHRLLSQCSATTA